MNISFKQLLTPLAAALLAFTFFVVDPSMVSAQFIDDATDRTMVNDQTIWGGSLRSAITTIINFFLFFLGIIAVAMIIFGGFLYITSQGDDGAVEKAKKIIMFSAIGIIVILISFAFVFTFLQVGQGDRSLT